MLEDGVGVLLRLDRLLFLKENSNPLSACDVGAAL